MSRGKYWCFTFNNPHVHFAVDPVDNVFLAVAKGWSGLSYICFIRQTGDSGTRHLQGYAEFDKVKAKSTICKLLPAIHWERRRGTQEQAISYIRDDDKHTNEPGAPFIEWGDKAESEQGKRTDLVDAISTLRSHGVRGVAREHPVEFVRFGAGLVRLNNVNSSPRLTPPNVYIAYGPSGCGKTDMAFSSNELDNIWFDPPDDAGWFDGYDGQETAILDDFDGKFSKWSLKLFLRVTDRYPLRVKVKGSYVQWKPDDIWITTNIHPILWWDYTEREEQYLAIQRRVTRVYHWRTDTPHPTYPITIDRDGNRALWDKWWAGPPAPIIPVMGPMDDFVIIPSVDKYNYINE